MKRSVPPSAHGGAIHWAAVRAGLLPEFILDFSASISCLGPPPGFAAAVRRGLATAGRYPDPDATAVTGALAEAFGLPAAAVRVGNGAAELIHAFFRSLGPRRVLLVEPTFGEYERAVRLAGGRVLGPHLLRPEEDWALDLAALAHRLPRAEVVVVCNPNNPTGTLATRAALVDLVKRAGKKGVLVVVDEAFMDFVEDVAGEGDHSLCRMVGECPNLVVFRSFTKFFALPGLRLGCCLAAPESIEGLRRHQTPWSVNCIAQAIGECLYGKDTRPYRDRVRSAVTAAREAFAALLTADCDLKVWSSPANYLLVDLAGRGIGSSELQARLARKGFLIRDCSSFLGLWQRFFRLAVRTEEENKRLVGALRQEIREVRNGGGSSCHY